MKRNYVVAYVDRKGIIQKDLVKADNSMAARAWVLWNRALIQILSSVLQK